MVFGHTRSCGRWTGGGGDGDGLEEAAPIVPQATSSSTRTASLLITVAVPLTRSRNAAAASSWRSSHAVTASSRASTSVAEVIGGPRQGVLVHRVISGRQDLGRFEEAVAVGEVGQRRRARRQSVPQRVDDLIFRPSAAAAFPCPAPSRGGSA